MTDPVTKPGPHTDTAPSGDTGRWLTAIALALLLVALYLGWRADGHLNPGLVGMLGLIVVMRLVALRRRRPDGTGRH